MPDNKVSNIFFLTLFLFLSGCFLDSSKNDRQASASFKFSAFRVGDTFRYEMTEYFSGGPVGNYARDTANITLSVNRISGLGDTMELATLINGVTKSYRADTLHSDSSYALASEITATMYATESNEIESSFSGLEQPLARAVQDYLKFFAPVLFVASSRFDSAQIGEMSMVYKSQKEDLYGITHHGKTIGWTYYMKNPQVMVDGGYTSGRLLFAYYQIRLKRINGETVAIEETPVISQTPF